MNSVIKTFVQEMGGLVVSHPHIRFDSPGLFLRDGVHFSTLGNDIFFKNISEVLKAHYQVR